MRKIIAPLIVVIVFALSGCGSDQKVTELGNKINNLETQISSLKELNNSIKEQYDNMIKDINTKIVDSNNKILDLEGKIEDRNTHSNASLVSVLVNDSNASAVIDFTEDVGEISFFVFIGDIRNPEKAQDYQMDIYDEIINPGVGGVLADDVPKGHKRYELSFPATENDTICILAFCESTNSFWMFERMLQEITDI